MRRSFSSALLLCFLLGACGGSGSKKSAACVRQYWDGTVGFCLPAGWSAISKDQLREKGISDDVIVAVKRDQAVAGQFPTLTVTQESLSQETDPENYSSAAVQSVTVLPGYRQVDVRKVPIDASSLNLHVFIAQPKPEEAELRFYQLSYSDKLYGYTVTVLSPVSPTKDLENEILGLMQSVTAVDPRSSEEG